MIYDWMYTLRPLQLQSKMQELKIATKLKEKIKPHNFKIFPQKKKTLEMYVLSQTVSM